MAETGNPPAPRPHDPSRALHEAAFNALPEAAAAIDSNGGIFAVNAAFCSLFGDGPWPGQRLDSLFVDPLDVHAAPWRRARSRPPSRRPARSYHARLTGVAGPPFAATLRIGALPGDARIVLISRDDGSGTGGREDLETELALAVEMGGLSRWRFDPATGSGRIEGPLAHALGGPEFGPSRWSEHLSAEGAGRLEAALHGAEHGGVELSAALRNTGAGGRVTFKGRSGPGGVIAGFASAAQGPGGAAPGSREVREAAVSAQMSAWTYDIATERLRLTGAVLGVLGLPGDEYVLDIQDWRARVPETDWPQMDLATRSLQTKGVADVEYRVRAEDGRLVWLALRGGVSEQSEDGAALRFSGFLSEVGARKRLERQLAEREQELADAVDAGLVGIWTFDYATRTQTARGRILDWMGKPRDARAVDGEDWLRVIHRDDEAALLKAFAQMADGATVERLDVRLKTPQGWRWVRTHGAPIAASGAASPHRAAGVIVDIHAEHAYADALASQKERSETFYRQTPALLHTIDAQGRTRSVSDYWLKRMGHAREDVLGAPGWAFMDDDSAERVRTQILPRTLEEGWVENEPVVAFTASGARLDLRLSAFLEVDEAGAPVAAHGVFSDVTDLRTTQRELEAHAEALERTNRELDRFATMASHDLQEPLRKISAFASLLRRRLAGEIDADSEQALAFLVDATGRMRTLIDDLLAYSRASNRTLELRLAPLDALVGRVLSGLDLQIAEADARITVGSLPEITGDEVLLGLLFQNLIANALKYRKPHGVHVTISAARRADGAHAITVADNGIGFDPAFAEKIFEPFARLHTREAYSGTGIGLAICQQAAERMHGRIEVVSKPGSGSAFTVILPGAESLADGAAA